MEPNPIFSDERDEFLIHYGVLGMKWGVRRNPAKAGARVRAQIEKNRKKADRLRDMAYIEDRTFITGESKTARRARYQALQAKYERKAARAANQVGPLHPRAADQYAKYINKAAKYDRKAKNLAESIARKEELNAKAAKLDYKSARLERAYKKEIGKLDKKAIKKGENKVTAMLAGATGY